MKPYIPFLSLIALTLVLSFGSCQPAKEDNANKVIAEQCCSENATCSGTKSCSACKNCKYCKHCSKNGGTCGVCK